MRGVTRRFCIRTTHTQTPQPPPHANNPTLLSLSFPTDRPTKYLDEKLLPLDLLHVRAHAPVGVHGVRVLEGDRDHVVGPAVQEHAGDEAVAWCGGVDLCVCVF